MADAPIVLGFVGENANATLANSTDGLNGVLSRHGFEAHAINTRQPDWSDKLKHFITGGRVAFAYGYAGVGSVMRNGTESFWTAFRTPFLSLMYDHPFYNLANHTVDSPWVANAYFVPDYAEVQKKYVRNPHLSFTIRDGIAPAPGPHLEPQHWRQRSIPFIFVKSGGNDAKMQAAIAALSAPERTLFHTCREALQKSADLMITDLIAARAREMKADNFGNREFGRMVVLLDRFMRDWRSRELVEWLKHKPAVIIGDEWDAIDKTGCPARFLPPKPFHEIDPLYFDSRFIFNANPYSREGCHERTFGALERGAVAVSDRNRFSDQNLAQLKNFVGFDWGDFDWREKLDARIAELEKSSSAFDAAATQNRVASLFPADKLVTNIVAAIQEIRIYANDFSSNSKKRSMRHA